MNYKKNNLSDPFVVWFYKREKKKRLVWISVVGTIVMAVVLQLTVFLTNHNDKIVVAMPEAFCVYNGRGDESDLQKISVENGKRTYHIEVDENCLNTSGSYVYVTGTYWRGFLVKPVVHLDGEDVEVETSATGYGGRYYHFYIRDVIPDQKYRIYVRCGEKNDYINVVFHAQ